MLRGIFKATTFAAVTMAAAAGSANAGGLERGGYNIDLLFDPSPFAFDSSFTYVMPDRTLRNVRDTDTSVPPPIAGATGLPAGRGGGDLNGRPDSVTESESYLIPRFGVKINVVDPVDCLLDYSQPWGAHTNPGANWAGANSNIETKVNSNNFAATCSYKFDVGPGNLRIIGGALWQEVYGFKERLVVDPALLALLPLPPLSGVGRLDLAGEGYGWRAGVAYEMPEIALRASLVYNSEVDLGNITGTVDLSQTGAAFTPISVHGTASMPDSVELKLQSGIAPGWLAFGSAKWVDWSELQTVPFYCDSSVSGVCAANGEVTSLNLLYQDGWTISGGVGHKFTDQLSGAVALTWDRGVSQGYGSLTDTWSVSGGVSFTPNERLEFRVGGLAGILTSGFSHAIASDGVTYDFDNDFVGALSLAARVKF